MSVSVTLKRDEDSIRFLIMNTIMSKTKLFSREEIIKDLKDRGIEANSLLDECLEDLLKDGLIYKINNEYFRRAT